MISYNQLNDIVLDTFSNLNFSKEPKNLYEPIDYIINIGGKRVRPFLTLAACNLFSDDIQPAINPSVGIEIFHNFTLLHDDIMDKADIRRGQKTVHRKWDQNIAILSGDAMTIIAYQYIAGVNSKHLPKVLDIFSTFALGICEGQQLDMDFESRNNVTRAEYLRMIELKTSILLKGALQIGAVVGGATDEDIDRIGEFGRCLGLAFQLQDDLLDTFGNTETFGKSIGGDIVAGKKTALTIETIQLLDSSEATNFIDILSNKTLPRDEKICNVVKFYAETNAKGVVENLIDDYFNQATEALNLICVPAERKVVLTEISQKLMSRNS